MEGFGCSLKEKAKSKHKNLLNLVFSWSLEDIFNEELYKDQVEKIPESFESVQHYLGSFVYPLLEEIRAELASSLEAISSAPLAEVVLNESKPSGALLYDVRVDYWRNSSSHHGQESYKALPGDFFVFTEAKPENVSDLQRVGRTWTFGSITKISGDDNNSMGTNFKVKVSNDLEVEDGKQKFLYMVFLMNITTNKRIWNALHRFGNLEVIKKVLCIDTLVEEICDLCPVKRNEICAEKLGLSSTLNKSQYEAVVDSICKMQCNHKSFVKLIWGPPGTGKTRTLSLLLWNLVGLNCRTLVCAPTNAAITEVASRVLELVKQSFDDAGRNALFCCLGDILLFGNKQQMKVCSDFEEIYLDYRVEKLAQCLGPVDGWKHCFASMIEFFEGFVSWYQKFCGNDLINEKEVSDQNEDSKVESKLFLGSVRENFETSAFPLRRCVSIFCTHLPKSLILEHNFRIMVSLIALLDSFETLLLRYIVVSEVEGFSHSEMIDDAPQFLADTSTILCRTTECLTVLRSLQKTLNELNLPCTVDKGSLVDFCFKMASSIFCKASSSYKLHSVVMEPLQLLVIDEAAQLKECESIIPLQLPGTRDAILIGDEFQLPAIVNSNVSDKAGFGRSLFERMSLLGHPKHLLDTQYRMHPSISLFPNSKFYNNQIIDAPNVKNKNYKKCLLPGPMFGPYSFINISGGKEMLDVRHSRKNMVEVAVVLKIVQMLYKACNESKEMLSVGVVSPYAAQVAAIQQKLGQKYENHCSFTVKVKSIDRYQGGEDDIIILSTVRSTSGGSIGFISSPHRTNVALTRARNCLWILGNEKTLTNSGSVWKELITDAKVRQCYFNADKDEDLTNVIVEVKKELDELDDLLNGDSILFKAARWKVLFSDIFRRSFVKLKSSEMRNLVLLLLLKLCNGWRPKRSNVDIICESSLHILKKFKVQGLYIICSVDIVKELWYIQVLKVWDILPLEDIPKLVRRLDGIFGMYTDDYLNHCKVKCFEGDLLVPATWASSADIVQYKDLSNTGSEKVSNDGSFDKKIYVEDSKVNDSLLLMKFYSLSSGVVSHLLSGCDGRELGLAFELTDQENEIVFFNRSTFILGRSGTGKTTVLTMKLFQNEQLYHIASEGFHEVVSNLSSNVSWGYKANESNGETKRDMLHQIFVTVSPKLCYAVKQQVSHLKSFVCGGDSSAGSTSIHMDDIDDTTQFFDIPDSFVDLPPKSYPLVITFHKFLMMLDGTVAVSYFERFPDVRQLCHGKNGNSRSIALETFIRTKEVNYHRFSWAYWPHFNIQMTNKLESTRVFTEIMSVIKGGLRAGEDGDGKLSRQDYVLLSESRGSTLSRKQRERIYDIFLQYEKKKVVDGDFDLADLVNDLHRRLKEKRFVGDGIDFVYIDEVQDLSIRQIALFKYICRNVEEGFVFAGDTAQTIARGVDFRFEDIRCLFYKEFLRGSGPDVVDGRKEKGQISDIFHLSQNFRTHGGVLNLAQSVIDLLYHFFPLSIDILSPETSLLYGEAPILLDSKNKENVIRTIFQNGGTVDGNIVGFGAEQVILVRDDSLRKEICDYVGKKALVLTILECKGLEFQDVLLYNFFSSSPFKNKWRVIYEYMKERGLLDSNSPPSFPSFIQEKHNLLCSEMKQLYVAITRTKQRLWICENVDELSEPMFHYWKKLSIVQVRQLDDSFVKEMQVASSRDEWKSRGIKLFYEGNYKMAIMCFERAGDMYWERWAKAAELRVTADCMHGPNPEKSRILLKEAAEIFDSIGRAELAAQCFFKSEEYERAGKIYLENCGDSKLDRAGECFSLAGCYKCAAEVYARANSYSMCLSACIDGKLFDLGLFYIQSRKLHTQMDKIVLNFLQQGALYYYELKNNKAMIKFVESFHSMDSIRSFLKNLNCLDELLLMEKERGNFLEAADIAKLKKDPLLEADLVEKAGYFREASMLILWYVFSNSLHPLSSKCRPPKWLTQKDKLLTKAKSTAKNHSDPFYDFVCKEAEILSEEKINGNVFEMGLQFIQFWKQKAPTGVGRIKRGYEIDKIEQDMFKRCAHHYHDLKDNRTMMRYVKAFHSRDLIRSFLKNLNCLDELLSMEKEWGNFLEAADIAKLKKDLLLESDLVEEAGYFREASMLILWYVFSNSLPPLSSKCRFPKQYTQKDELLTKAISIAKNDSDTFYDFVSKEAEILSEKNINGNVFEMGLKFIQLWKQKAPTDVGRVKIGYEIDKIEQDMLERCARHYHDLKDNRTMMKYIKAFHSSNLMRTFLMSLNCLDEVLLLEEEWGNFWQAAKIAKQKGYLLREAGLLEKAGHFDEACMVLLLYVFASSLWVSGSQGWPLKEFNQKEELLTMAKSWAKKYSDQFYEFVCMEVNILSNNESSLSEMMQNMVASQRLKSLGGEILSAWKILDDHLRSNTSKYEWNNFLVFDLLKHSEDMISQNRISVETLIYFWNFWKEKILNLVHYIRCIGTPGVSKYTCYEEFCLNFMGVRKPDGNKNTIYLLLYSDAIWVREVDYRSLWGKGNLVSIDAHNFVSAALSYWCSELLSVGLKVLETLNTLYDYSLRNFFSLFQQTMSLLHICEVAKFLQENMFLNCRHNGELVQKSLELASRCHFGNVFPLDWRKSLIESMIFLRGSKLSMNLVSEAISRNISSKSPLTYGQVGRVVMMILGSGKLSYELYERIVRSFDWNLQWRAFIEEIVWNIVPDFKLGSATRNSSNASGEVSLVCGFHKAVEDTYYANWRTEQDYISPACFLYLVERLLILASYFQGYIFTTKSSVVEWLIFQEWSINPSAISKNDTELSVILGKIHNSMACIVQELLLNKHDTMEWFETSKSSSDDYYPVLVLRLIVLLSLICVNSGKHFDKLFYLLGRSDITSVLPCEFCEALLRARKCYFIYALADALGKIENPLVLVSLGNNFSNFLCPDAIFINMEANRCGEEILRELFQKKGVTTHSRSGNPEKGFDLPLFNFAHAASNTQICNEAYPGKKCCLFWEIFYALETFEFRKGGNIMGFMSVASIIKVEVEKIFQLSSAAVASCQENSYQNDNLLVEAKSMLAELKLLSFALDISERTLEDNISTIGKLSKSLQCRRPRLEPFLDHLFLQNEKDTAI